MEILCLKTRGYIGNLFGYLLLAYYVVWFLASFGAGIIFREFLDQYFIGGAPLGFWFAQQGAIYVFLIIIIIYCLGMSHLEKKYGLH